MNKMFTKFLFEVLNTTIKRYASFFSELWGGGEGQDGVGMA